jgi:hypothetical protein
MKDVAQAGACATGLVLRLRQRRFSLSIVTLTSRAWGAPPSKNYRTNALMFL